jgi:hypothetical protein
LPQDKLAAEVGLRRFTSAASRPPLARLPALTSGRYTGEFNEVKALGAKTGSLRTPQQTEMFRPLVGHPPDQAPPLGEPYEQGFRS